MTHKASLPPSSIDHLMPEVPTGWSDNPKITKPSDDWVIVQENK